MSDRIVKFHGSFIDSLWGACCGVALSAVIALLILQLQDPPRELPSGFLPENTVYGNELPEKIFFLASFVLGSVGAFIATIKPIGWPRSGVANSLWFLGFIFFVSQWMRYVYGSGAWHIWCISTIVWLALPPLTGKLLNFSFTRRNAGAAENSEYTPTAPDQSLLGIILKIRFDIISLTILALMILPSSIAIVAARIGFDPHPVAFIVGPSLFLRGENLIPGRDFFTQYGVGQGFFFSFFVGNNAQDTIENFTRLMATLTWVFYGISYVVLRLLLSSRWWAFSTVVFMVILNFHLDRTFVDPSSWPIRYPFLFITVWLVIQAIRSNYASKHYLILGICCGLSIFWNTETGIYSLITSCFVTTALNNFTSKRTWVQTTNVFVACAVTFLWLSWLAYGIDIFSSTYLLGLIEPMLIFGSGYAAVPVNWNPGWGYLYNLTGPILCISTIGWVLAETTFDPKSRERDSLIGIFTLAVIGLLFLLKWVNMSLDAVWHMNAYPTIIVASWWLRKWFFEFTTNKVWSIKFLIAFSIICCSILFLMVVNDPRNRSAYAGKAFLLYPSLLKRAIVKPDRYQWPTAQSVISQEDVELIIELTGPRERVAIIHPTDWAYLIQARRAPRFHFLPSTSTFLGKHLERSLADAPYIFIKRALLQGDMIKSHSDYIRPLLRDHYELHRQGIDLVVYKRTN